MDCLVALKVKIEVDGEVKFCHNNFDQLDYTVLRKVTNEEDEEVDEVEPIFPDNEFERFDLEEYTVPSIIRKILKTTKLREVVQVRTTRKDKFVNYFDEDTKCFKKDILQSFQKDLVITFALIGFQQKDYIFKLLISEKAERFNFLKSIGTKFYKIGNYKKALKIYSKINMYFRSKDAKNNFQKEDEQTLDFRDAKDEL